MPVGLLDDLKEHFANAELQMPNLPHVATEALVLANDDKSTSAQLAALICKDQALATNLLRMANSPAFGGARSIVSLQQAITRLGMQTVAELAVTICVKGSLFPKKRFAAISGDLWTHSFATALFAKEIARQQRSNVEAAYLCGLLHRIGKPLVLKAIADIRDPKHDPSSEEVTSALDSLQVEIGLRASESWQLPSQVMAAIRYSQDYAGAESHRSLAAMVNLAGALASALIAEQGFDEVRGLSVLDELCIYPDQLQSIFDHHERIEAAIA